MNDLDQVMAQLRQLAKPATRQIYLRHGAPENSDGVAVADLKKLARDYRQRQDLALQLYETGHGDAQYLAGLIARGHLMSAELLDHWAATASWYMVAEYTVPWVCAESAHAWDCPARWIENEADNVCSAAWSTLAANVAVIADERLDLARLEAYLGQVEKTIHHMGNRSRYAMNQFLISVGCYVTPLYQRALDVARNVGSVAVDLGQTTCKVPLASAYITKVEQMGRLGKKRKTARC